MGILARGLMVVCMAFCIAHVTARDACAGEGAVGSQEIAPGVTLNDAFVGSYDDADKTVDDQERMRRLHLYRSGLAFHLDENSNLMILIMMQLFDRSKVALHSAPTLDDRMQNLRDLNELYGMAHSTEQRKNYWEKKIEDVDRDIGSLSKKILEQQMATIQSPEANNAE